MMSKSSLLDLTNLDFKYSNLISTEPKSNATSHIYNNKEVIVKQSPLNTVFPQYFYSRNQKKSTYIFSKYGQVVIS